MPLVTTGQLTITDQNDARPITSYITVTPGPQQVYSKDESTTTYTPDWTTVNTNTGIRLTAKVFLGGVGSATDITANLTNRRWSTDLTNPITGTAALISSHTQLNALFLAGASRTFTSVHDGTGSTLNIRANFLETVNQAVIYFEGDYADPATGLVSKVVASIQLGMIRTGSNAVYITIEGQTAIEPSTGTTKNLIAVAARLNRASGVDTTGVSYRWYEANGATQIVNSVPFNTEYGLKTVAAGTQPTVGGTTVGTSLPAAAAWSADLNTLVIHESAVTEMGVYRVEARDADNVIYQAFFTVYDVSDPYQCNILSSSGDKLQNGVGSTNLTPSVYYGAAVVPSLTGWTFTWTFYNRDGNRAAFVDTTRTAQAGGRTISANTTGASATITYGGAAFTGVNAGDIVKVVRPDGLDRYYEVLSVAANVVTIRTPSTNTWLNYTTYPTPAVANDLVGGRMYVCTASGGQQATSGATAITVTGDEIDVKGRITCEANRP